VTDHRFPPVEKGSPGAEVIFVSDHRMRRLLSAASAAIDWTGHCRASLIIDNPSYGHMHTLIWINHSWAAFDNIFGDQIADSVQVA
jgi:hypothetical protein